MRFFFLLLSLVLVSSPARAGTNWTAVHETTVRGINLLYNLEMDRALAAFDSVAVLAPGDPRGRFFRSMVHFWKFSLRNDESDFRLFITHSDSVIALCEGLIDRDGSDPVPRFYLGGIKGYRGLAHRMRGSLLDAVMEGRSAYLSLEEAVHLKPDMPDAHMGFGLFRYLVAKMPPSLSWVTTLLGFEGDLEGGLQSLRYAADNGIYTRSEANLYLSQFLRREGEKEEAERRLGHLIATHPNNTLFLVLFANWEYRDDRFDEALALLNKAEEINNMTSIRHGEEFIFSTRGAIAFRKNDFVLARSEFDRFMKLTTVQGRVPNVTFYRIAAARELCGDREGAVEAVRFMKDDDESFRRQSGEFFFRKGMELAVAPFSPAQKILLRADNARARGETDSASAFYHEALADPSADSDVRAQALYGLQEIAFDAEDFEQAVRLGAELVRLPVARERWIPPHGYLTTAKALRMLNRFGEAERALDTAEDFDGYDFQESLERDLDEERTILEDQREQAQR